MVRDTCDCNLKIMHLQTCMLKNAMLVKQGGGMCDIIVNGLKIQKTMNTCSHVGLGGIM